ncbi:intelectin-like, partial [Clarias magur]
MESWIVVSVAFASVNLCVSFGPEMFHPQSCKELMQKYQTTEGDRWSSQQGGHASVPEGDGSWSNTVTFGTAEAATSDDFKNPGYYDITAEDVAVWHVPNDERVNQWKHMSFLRYHTETRFLNSYGGNLYHLFQRFPVKYNVGSCPADHGPSVPVVYDVGDAASNHNLYGPHIR